MASGASNTLTKELRIELKFVTTEFIKQTRTAVKALNILNSRFKKVQDQARITGNAFTGVAREAKKLGNREVSSAVNQNAKALRSVEAGAKGASKSLDKYSKSVGKASSRTTTATKNAKSFSTSISNINVKSRSADKSVNGLSSALGAFVTVQSARAALRNALAFDRVENRMRGATVSTEEFNQKTAIAADLANKLGVDLISASRGYATLTAATRGSGVEGTVTDQLFESILKTSAALSLTADETNSVVLAFGQVASKGRAAAEEIRGQIGERIPGFYTKLAEALGKSQAELTKLLDQGLLSSDQALEASARALEKAFGDKAVDNANSLTANINRISNGLKAIVAFSTTWLEDNLGVARTLGEISKRYSDLQSLGRSNQEAFNKRLASNVEIVKQINQGFAEGNLTLEERNAKIDKVLKSVRGEKGELNLFGLGKTDLDELSKINDAIADILTERDKDVDLIKKSKEESDKLLKSEEDRLEKLKKIKELRKKERDEFNKLVNLEFQANLSKENLKVYFRLKEAQEKSLALAEKMRKEEEDAKKAEIDRVKLSIKSLKDKKKLLDSIRLSPQEANAVTAVAGFSIGQDDNADRRRSALARSRELGATRGSVRIAEQQLATSERIEAEIRDQTRLLEKLQERDI